ncbi:putative BsuMI modification methylase subunit YdiO [Sulfitobacter sp. THAF37]|nr:putative BsuMI modification methylase subunit YdiO [Sulfitobacter sp. THAF37]
MKILAGIDYDGVALKTYQHNFPEASALQRNISDLTCEQLQQEVGEIERPLLFSACAPCQPFSNQNRHKDTSDKRVVLLDEFHRFVEHFQPDFLVLENVPGMQKVDGGPFFRFTDLLDRLDYKYDHGVLDAVDYGVPQSRRRLVLVAARNGEAKLPKKTHGDAEGLIEYATVRDAISHYPELEAGATHHEVPNHQTAQISEVNLERLRHTPEGGDRRDWPEHLLLKCHKKKTGYTDTYGRLSWSLPAKTLTTKCISISNGRFGHPNQNRGLSVREAAALQSFPDDFMFLGTVSQTARQVGNAVPVSFAETLGKQLMISVKEI